MKRSDVHEPSSSSSNTPKKRPRISSDASSDGNASSEAELCIGVLALQGAFKEHAKMLEQTTPETATLDAEARAPLIDHGGLSGIRVTAREVRTAKELEGLDGIILPGGESTAMAKIATRFGSAQAGSEDDMLGALRRWAKEDHRPVWGTCAGLIFLADRIVEGAKVGGQAVIGGLDVGVSRNFFGKQISSFEAYIKGPPSAPEAEKNVSGQNNAEEQNLPHGNDYLGVFIRAPAVLDVGSNVNVLATVPTEKNERGSVVVAVEQGNMLATAFHPELTDDLRWHRYFVQKCLNAKRATNPP